jgi:xanthine dehydrogenase YagR molybdenum-binding subunit
MDRIPTALQDSESKAGGRRSLRTCIDTVLTVAYSIRCDSGAGNLVDKAAYAINMNPLDFRLKISTRRAIQTQRNRTQLWIAPEWKKQPGRSGGKPNSMHPKPKKYPVSSTASASLHHRSHGAGGTPATASVVLNSDGTLSVVSAAAEVGPGERTIMAMIAAEALGMPFDRTSISPDVDTDFTSDTGNTAGSRQTISGGWGAYEAAMDARQQALKWAAEKFMADAKRATPPRNITVKTEDLDIKNGVVMMISDPSKTLKMQDVVAAAGKSRLSDEAHIFPTDWERMAFAAHAAEVEVDIVTGSVKILKRSGARCRQGDQSNGRRAADRRRRHHGNRRHL